MFGLKKQLYSKKTIVKQSNEAFALTGSDKVLLANNPQFLDAKELLEPLYVP